MKKDELKTPELLSPAILAKSPVWEFINDDELGELMMRPIRKLPVRNLDGRLAGAELQLANGQKKWGLLGNVKVNNPRLNEHFITLSVENDGKWFTMSRYHDYDAIEQGPDALARFLDMDVDKIFPISYDIRSLSRGESASLMGRIEKEPKERLTRRQVVALAVRRGF